MTNQEKEQIKKLRLQGNGYGKIAQVLSIPKSTVSSFCKKMINQTSQCLECNKKLKQSKGHRQKKFCCDKCRMNYWKSHKDEINRKLDHSVKCYHCDKEFLTYKSLKRKYCSQECFIKSRVENRANE